MQVEEIQCLFLMDTLLTYIFLFLGILYSMYKDYIRPRFFSVSKKWSYKKKKKKDKKASENCYEEWIFNM